MNELEKQKQVSNNDKVEETSKRLSEGFLALADLLQDNLYVSRECVLTSFSINPTWPCMERIENLAISCGALKEQDSDEPTNKLNTLETNDNKVNQLNNVNDKNITEVPPLDTGQTSVFSNSELSKVLVPQTLGLSEQLCDDLAVILSSPRYQFLSWVLNWPELKSACHSYLVNSQRNVVKELKYLNIDYNQFKDWPDEQPRPYSGIEKGYEQYTDENNSNTESDYMSYDQGYNDSDSSSTTDRTHRRKVRKVYSSDSDYEININIRNNKIRVISSDMDTASQDADSLGSDGLQPAFGNTKSNINPPRTESISPFTLLMNGRNEPNRKLLSIFEHHHRDRDRERERNLDNSPLLHSFMLPEKRSSDPKILKTLRMFRSNKKRNRDGDSKPLKNPKNLKSETVKLSDGKVIKLPLTPSMNPRVLLDRQDCNNLETKYLQKNSPIKDKETENMHKFPTKISPEPVMNPRVILDRYEDLYSIYKSNINSSIIYEKSRTLEVLADVPGLNTLEMIRPSVVHPTVQVVQVTTNLQNTQIRPAKSQNSSTATTSNIITSTPITAHIQRVGNIPQTDKPQESDSQENQSPSSSSQSSSESCRVSIVSPDSGNQSETPSPITSAIATKPPNSHATPTLVNILSQQIIRPAQANTSTNRNSALINILSQQIIKPPITQLPQKIFNVGTSSLENVVNISVGSSDQISGTVTTTAPSVVTSVGQLQLQNSIKLVSTSQAQPVAFQHIINAQAKNNNQVLKNVNLVTSSASAVDATRLVQFLCKTDGKVVHLTPYPNANIKLQTIDPSKLIKTTTVISKPATTQSTSRTSISSPIRSSYEENFTKFIQTNTRAIPVKTVQGEFNHK